MWSARRHTNRLVQEQADLHGDGTFEVLAVIPTDRGQATEQYFVDATPVEKRLNLQHKIADRPKGRPWSNEQLASMAAGRRRPKTVEQIKKTFARRRESALATGRKVRNSTTGKVYASVRVACESLDLNIKVMRRHIAADKPKTMRGQLWHYLDEPEKAEPAKCGRRKGYKVTRSASHEQNLKTKSAEAKFRSVRNLDTGISYKSLIDAANDTGLRASNIAAAAAGKYSKSCGGFRWSFKGLKADGAADHHGMLGAG